MPAVPFAALPWPSSGETTRLAAALIPLVLDAESWVHRRKESLEFISDTRLERRVSVDFTVPHGDGLKTDGTTLGGVEVACVPLTLLAKRPLTGFDVRDEDGRPLPVLNTSQNGPIAATMLGLLAELVLRKGRRGVPDLEEEIWRDLVTIAAEPAPAAFDALRRMEEAGKSDPSSTRGKLWSDSRVRTLATDLSHQFVLIAVLKAKPGERRIVKFAYEQQSPLLELDLRQRLGLRPLEIGTLAPAAAGGMSYHLEAACPGDLVLERARLVDISDPGQHRNLKDETTSPGRVHLHVSGQERGSRVAVVLEIRSGPWGTLPAALVITGLATAVFVGGLVAHAFGYSPSVDAAAALVVGLPGVAAGYLARPGEHSLVRTLLAGPRVLLAVIALLSFAAAGVLAVDLPTWIRVSVWIAAAATGVFSFTVFLTAYWRARKVDRRRGPSDSPTTTIVPVPSSVKE